MQLSFVLSFVSIFLILFNFVYAEEYIKKLEVNGLKSISEKEFLYLMGVKENQTFTAEEITKGIKRVFLKNVFDDIVVEYKEGVMKISVKEKPFIDKIEIKGNEHFSESFFKKLLTFKKGDRLKEIEIKKNQLNIEEELKKRGFINCRIQIEKNFNENYVNITIYVNEGEPLRIKNIKWEGNFDEYIKNLFYLNVGDPFDKVLLEDFIKNMKKYFAKQGLVGSEITYSFKDGELTLIIKEGKKLDLEFNGVDSLSENDLKNIAMAHFQDKVNDNIIKDTINSLITFYRANGFIDVKIIPLMEEEENKWKITYFVKEGDRRTIEKIEIQTEVSQEEIKNILANKEGYPFNPEELENDRQRIEDYFKTKGYYFAQVLPPQIEEKDNKVKILFKAQKGKQIKIKNIDIEVNDNLLKSETQKLVKTYEDYPFNEAIFLEIKRKIREVYLKNGYSDATIEGKYEIKDSNAYINLKIEPGNKKYFGKSIILGNEKTKTKFIYQRLLPKENEPYDPYTLEEERQTLYKTGLFSRIDIKPQPQDGTVDLIYNFEETPAGAFEFGFGYGEYEKAKGFAELSYINLFGMNKQIFSRVELSSLEKRSYITYVDPWMWENLTFKSSLLFERSDIKNIDTKDIIYKLKRYSASAGFEKNFLSLSRLKSFMKQHIQKHGTLCPRLLFLIKILENCL